MRADLLLLRMIPTTTKLKGTTTPCHFEPLWMERTVGRLSYMLHTLQRERQQVCRLPEKYFVTRSSVVASFDLEFSFADFWSLSFSSSCWPCCAPSFPNLRFLPSTKERVQYKGMHHVITTAIENCVYLLCATEVSESLCRMPAYWYM